jgi:6-phosphogluconolactonase
MSSSNRSIAPPARWRRWTLSRGAPARAALPSTPRERAFIPPMRPIGWATTSRVRSAPSPSNRLMEDMIQADPSGRLVLHVDLGLDKIFVWRFDDQRGVLVANDSASVSLPSGDGPRHFHFHPNGRWLYSIQEEGSTIVLFDYDSGLGHLSPRQTISTLPPGFAGSNFCSEVLVSADGRYVYAGNRLHDSIAIFSVASDGRLTFVGEEWTRGDYPRSFAFDSTGRFLYCCNQRADAVTIFRVNRATGRLSFTGQYVPVGNPSIVVCLDLA